MSPRSLAYSLALATLAATPLITAPQAAHAQGLIDFLWGGTDEWGGKRQVVDFDQKYSADQVIVSFGDRRLYLITQKGKAISYPIAVPREQSRWQGTTTVSEKKINPSWRPTPDMLKENPKLPTWVPGGHPMNPLGVRAMYLGASTYRIHGTDAPWTIGQAVSKGCIRMYNEDVLDLYPRVPVGMKVTVTWQQFNSQSVASNDDSTPPPFDPQPAGTSSKGMTRTIRNLPPPPAGTSNDLPPVSAGNQMAPPDPSTSDKPKPIARAKAPKLKMPATAVTAASTPTASTSSPAASSPAATPAAPASTAAATPPPAAVPAKTETSDPVAVATKAAAAATRAAVSARAAAEAAKKAAADAQKATSADGEEPGKDEAAKRAAL
jgi:lipoprotein-anchoring transpeptidase ErfK/SrfK